MENNNNRPVGLILSDAMPDDGQKDLRIKLEAEINGYLVRKCAAAASRALKMGENTANVHIQVLMMEILTGRTDKPAIT